MEGNQILGLVLSIIGAGSMFGFIIYGGLSDDWNVFVPMPIDFKYYTKMNWLGCIVCYIFLFILFPLFNIGKVVYWMFHVKKG